MSSTSGGIRLGRPIVAEEAPDKIRAPKYNELLENASDEEEQIAISRVFGTAIRFLRRNPDSLLSTLNVRCRVCHDDWRTIVEALITDGVIIREAKTVGERKTGGPKTSLLLRVADDFKEGPLYV